MKKTFKTIGKIASGVITFTLFLALIFMVVIVISSKASGGEPQVFGYQLKTVLSGSMEPDIKTGSIIAVKPGGDMTRFKEGDVITFQETKEKLITHRIVEIINSGEHVMYATKGDNNASADSSPVLSENVVAQYTGFTVPYAGYFTDFATSKNGSLLLLILPGILLLIYSGFTIWRALADIEKNIKTSSPTIDETTTPIK
ncbi:signal peptidase I SipW [Sutcliffiella halmapala]|uniref:signal peptidase I SipW n=1 Tax=Sutcliffiella halmapala TaxID=79882 RepID=UPI0009959AB4|nr:signal peptidase I [Sutcliffiella halmapala]